MHDLLSWGCQVWLHMGVLLAAVPPGFWPCDGGPWPHHNVAGMCSLGFGSLDFPEATVLPPPQMRRTGPRLGRLAPHPEACSPHLAAQTQS